MRFDFTLTKALSTHEISFGDLVAHSLPVSSLQHIASHLETLLNDASERHPFGKLLRDLNEFVEPNVFGEGYEDDGTPSKPLVPDVPAMLADVGTIFETRHLVAHEASFKGVNLETLNGLLRSARAFVDALFELVEQKLYPFRSRNGMGMSIQYAIEAEQIEASASEIWNRIQGKLNECTFFGEGTAEKLNAAKDAFTNYASAESELRFSMYGSGSGNLMRNIEANVTLALFGPRRDYLKELERDVDGFKNPPDQ